MRLRSGPSRNGATIVEVAIVLPIVFMLIFGLLVGAMGIFRYQEVSMLAREGARYASTHGYAYRKYAGQAEGSSSDWKTDMYNTAIKPQIVALDEKQLTVNCTWPDVINQPNKPDNWPGSKVEVTVTYKWLPEVLFVGPFYLSSKSSMPITN